MSSFIMEVTSEVTTQDVNSPQHRKLSYFQFYTDLKLRLYKPSEKHESIIDYLENNKSIIFCSLHDMWSVIRFESYKFLLDIKNLLPMDFRRIMISELSRNLELDISWQFLHGSLLGLQAILVECNSDLEGILIRLLGHPRLPVRESARGCLSFVEYDKDHNRFIYLILSSIVECIQNDAIELTEDLAFMLDGLLGCMSDILLANMSILLNDHIQVVNSETKSLFNFLIETLESAMSHNSSVVRQRAGDVVLLLCKSHLELLLKPSDKQQQQQQRHNELLYDQFVFLIHWISHCIHSSGNWKVQEGFYIVATDIIREILFHRLEDLVIGNLPNIYDDLILPLLTATRSSLASSLSHEVFEIRRVSAQLIPILVRATLFFNISDTLSPLMSISITDITNNSCNSLLPSELLAAASWISELVKASLQIEEAVFYQLTTDNHSESSSLLLQGKMSSSKSHLGAEDERTKFGMYIKSIASKYCGRNDVAKKFLSRPHTPSEVISLSQSSLPVSISIESSPLIALQQQVRSYLVVILNKLGEISTYLSENKLHSVDVTEAMSLSRSYYISFYQVTRCGDKVDNIPIYSDDSDNSSIVKEAIITIPDLELESLHWIRNVLAVQLAAEKSVMLSSILQSTGYLLGMKGNDPLLLVTIPSVTEPSSRKNINGRTSTSSASYSYSPDISPTKVLPVIPLRPPDQPVTSTSNTKLTCKNTSSITTTITPERKTISDYELKEAISIDRWLCEALCNPLLSFSKVNNRSSPYYLSILVIASRWRYCVSLDPRWLDGRPNALKVLSSTIAMTSEQLHNSCIQELDVIIDLEELAERRAIIIGIAEIILKVMAVVKYSEKNCTLSLVKALCYLIKFLRTLNTIIIKNNQFEDEVVDVKDPAFYEPLNQLISDTKKWIVACASSSSCNNSTSTGAVITYQSTGNPTSTISNDDNAVVIDLQDMDSILTPSPVTLLPLQTIATTNTATSNNNNISDNSDEFSDWDEDSEEEEDTEEANTTISMVSNLIFPFTSTVGATAGARDNSTGNTSTTNIYVHNHSHSRTPPSKHELLREAFDELDRVINENTT